MQFYGLSAQRVLRVLANPRRKEEGIAPGTVAQMVPALIKRDKEGHQTWKSEIWIMFEPLKNGAVKIITAWRYPGISPIRDEIPIPQDIIEELKDENLI
jgi:hypothetical protein